MRTVPGYPGVLVLENGSVIGRSGQVIGASAGRYVSIPWRTEDGKATTIGAHVLVALAYLGPRPPGHEVAHRNGDTKDNRPDNLRWSTHVDNLADRAEHGTDQVGERNPNRRLTEAEVRTIRAEAADGASFRGLARRYRTTRQNVRYIVRRETWRHVS